MSDPIDLLPELLASLDEIGKVSPHKIARQYVLEQGLARGGVEIMVAIDKDGELIAASTQAEAASVGFPPALKGQLQVPAACLVIHHNHPPAEEPFFSVTDMRGLAQNRGIGWLLMHNDTGYTAMRVRDRLFAPDASGAIPAAGLPAAYEAGRQVAQHAIYLMGLDRPAEATERLAPELALQALHQAGAIQHYSSFRTELGHELEQTIIRRVRGELSADSRRYGGPSVWAGAQGPLVSSAPADHAGADRSTTLPHTSTFGVKFDRFVDILQGRHPAIHDPKSAGRPQLAEPLETGRIDPGLESPRPSGRPLLEGGSGRKPLKRSP
jgi:hypothetical protein